MYVYIQGGSNMTGTDVARFTHKQSRSYLNHLVYMYTYTYTHTHTHIYIYIQCGNVRPLNFPCGWVWFSIALPPETTFFSKFYIHGKISRKAYRVNYFYVTLTLDILCRSVGEQLARKLTRRTEIYVYILLLTNDSVVF